MDQPTMYVDVGINHADGRFEILARCVWRDGAMQIEGRDKGLVAELKNGVGDGFGKVWMPEDGEMFFSALQDAYATVYLQATPIQTGEPPPEDWSSR